MAKWADYLISAVRYDSEGTRIEKAKFHEDKGDKVGSAQEINRECLWQVFSAENDQSKNAEHPSKFLPLYF